MIGLNGLQVPPADVTLVDEPVMGCLKIAKAKLGIVNSSKTGAPA